MYPLSRISFSNPSGASIFAVPLSTFMAHTVQQPVYDEIITK